MLQEILLHARAAEFGGQGGQSMPPPPPTRLVTMTHNTVAEQSPLLHHSMQHDRAEKTVILFPDIPPVCGSAYSHNYVIRL